MESNGKIESQPAPVFDLLSDSSPNVPHSPNSNQEKDKTSKLLSVGLRGSFLGASKFSKSAERMSSFGRSTTKQQQISYSKLVSTLKLVSANPEQKKGQSNLIKFVFPKLAISNFVDPQIGNYLIPLLQNCSNSSVLRYCYFFCARILSEFSNPKNFSNWEDSEASEKNAEVILRNRAEIVEKLFALMIGEASKTELAFHARKLNALKVLLSMPNVNDEFFTAIVQIIFTILDEVADVGKVRRRKSLFGRKQDQENAIRTNLYYSALSALRRLPIDPSSDLFIERVILGIGCPNPLGIRHALSMTYDLAKIHPSKIAHTLAKLAGGSLAEAIKINDVFARVYLARICSTLVHSSQLYDRSDLRKLFSAFLFQLLYDENAKVVLETINCICGFNGNEPSITQKADGWQMILTSVIDSKLMNKEKKKKKEKKDDGSSQNSSELVLNVIVKKINSFLKDSSRPLLHSTLRTITIIGKCRSAANFMGIKIEEVQPPEDDVLDFAQAMGKVAPRSTISVESLLGAIMESVRICLACECMYVRSEALKACIWMQSEFESLDELKQNLSGELADNSLPQSNVNDLLTTLQERFKASPGMAVMILDLANIFVKFVPGKMDTNALQSLWKMCLVGCGVEGKYLALESVSAILDYSPSFSSNKLDSSNSKSKSSIAQQRIIQAALWFLGENANYASEEYAWESSTPPGTALMMLDGERMVVVSSIRNPTLSFAIDRLIKCTVVGSWEERVIGVYALMTIAIRSGEPYRLQIYNFFHALIYGGNQAKETVEDASRLWNGEEKGASGTGLASVIQPMLKTLDEMYQAQEFMMNEIRKHDFSKEEWKDEELKQIYDSHVHLIDLASLFCFVPRNKYLPLGPISAKLVKDYQYKQKGNENVPDADVAAMMNKLLNFTRSRKSPSDFPPVELIQPMNDFPTASVAPPTTETINDFLGGKVDDSDSDDDGGYKMKKNSSENYAEMQGSKFDEFFSASMIETGSDDENEVNSASSSPSNNSARNFGNVQNWDEDNFSGALNSKEAIQTDSPSFKTAQSSLKKEENDVFKSVASNFSNFSVNNYDDYADEGAEASQNDPQIVNAQGRALYEFIGAGEDELNLRVGDEFEIEQEIDGWYFVRKSVPDSEGKTEGFVPVLYVDVL